MEKWFFVQGKLYSLLIIGYSRRYATWKMLIHRVEKRQKWFLLRHWWIIYQFKTTSLWFWTVQKGSKLKAPSTMNSATLKRWRHHDDFMVKSQFWPYFWIIYIYVYLMLKVKIPSGRFINCIGHFRTEHIKVSGIRWTIVRLSYWWY